MNFFEIDAKLPSLNDVIDGNRTNKYIGAKMKREVQDVITRYIDLAIARGTLRPTSAKCVLELEFCESNKKRDVDNVISSVKFILDAMVKRGIIPNDNPKYIAQIKPTVVYGEKNFVIVRLIEDE